MGGLNTKSLSDLVTTALNLTELSGLSEMLGVIARSVKAPIAILWHVAPEPIEDTLFIVAEWFAQPEETPSYFHTLHRETAKATYRALSSGKACAKDKIQLNDGEFLAEFGIRSLLSIPLDSDKTKNADKNYALNLYWTTESTLSELDSQNDIDQAVTLAGFLLDFYATLINKVSYSLVEACNEKLRQLTDPSVDSKGIAQEICKLISNKLQAHEVTLYLCEDSNSSNYCVQATTWERETLKTSRNVGNNTSLTDWVVTTKKCAKVFDLCLYEPYRAKYRQLYPDFDWSKDDIQGWKDAIRAAFKITDDKQLPPVSMIVVPILIGDRLLGVIRCCGTQKAPYYFSEQKKQLLVLVANQIAQAVDHRLNVKNITEENQSLKSFVENLASLNTYVNETIKDHEKLTQGVFIETLQGKVFKSTLASISQAIKNVDIAAIRLKDKDDEGEYLYFAEIYGSVSAAPDKKYYFKDRKDGQPAKAGVLVVETGKPYIMSDQNDRYYPLQSFNAKSMVIAPIKIGDDVIGVIDVRSNTANSLSPAVVSIMEVIGLQLGLYNDLFDKVVKLNQSVDDLKTEQEQQTQTYEDFAHQLKTPMQQMNSRVQRLIDKFKDYRDVPKELSYLRGSAAKAQRVSLGIRLFADLTKGKKLNPQLKTLTEDWLRKSLIECAIDQENAVDSSDNKRFNVIKDGFSALNRAIVRADENLLLQAINNLLDNAAKYSFSDTVVEIACGLTSSRKNFYISVTNTGYIIDNTDKENCKKRYWRGDDAKSVVGEGSGIGLWIVDHIMRAHDGELLINPNTMRKHCIEVRLQFPTKLRY